MPPPPPPAPWSTRLRAFVWWHRAGPEAVAALPPALRGATSAPVTLGAFVRYLDTPVGPYSEVLGSPVLLLGPVGGHVPFIAVDSEPSVRGGRRNWSLPKVAASFAWTGPAAVRAHGDDWDVTASARPSGPRLPFAAPARDVQVDDAGGVLSVPIAGTGVARAARVTVGPGGPGWPTWLCAGDHAGVVLDRARVRFGPARR